jgi:hypothetical protein
MNLPIDIIRYISNYLLISDIYALINVIRDFASNNFWKMSILRDFGVDMCKIEWGLNFVLSYRDLYKKYYLFINIIGNRIPTIPPANYISQNNDYVLPETIEPKNIRLISNVGVKNGVYCETFFNNGVRKYIYFNGKWIKRKKLAMIEELSLSCIHHSIFRDNFYCFINFTPYMDQIKSNQIKCGANYYSSHFTDWRMSSYRLRYFNIIFNKKVKCVITWDISDMYQPSDVIRLLLRPISYTILFNGNIQAE